MQATTVGRTKAIEVREITIFLNKTDFISKRIFAPKILIIEIKKQKRMIEQK